MKFRLLAIAFSGIFLLVGFAAALSMQSQSFGATVMPDTVTTPKTKKKNETKQKKEKKKKSVSSEESLAESDRKAWKDFDCKPEPQEYCGQAGFWCNTNNGEFCGSHYVVSAFSNGPEPHRYYQCFYHNILDGHCPQP